MMKKYVLFGIFLVCCFIGLFAFQYFHFHDGKTHIIFCNVGQGDSILVRSPAGHVLLFDGGPDDKVLSCLASHLPFWVHSIDLLFLSHPHADHFVGMFGVLSRFTIAQFVTEMLVNDNSVYRAFLERVKENSVPIKYVYAGDAYRLSDGVTVSILGPSRNYLQQTSPNGRIGEKAEFASLIARITYNNFSLLLTGDSQANGVLQAIQSGKITVLQVPHHGSKTGLSEGVLEAIQPGLAVISVGKNSYGHPSKQTLDLLKSKGVAVKRTDWDGDVEIVTDGKDYVIR